MTNDKNIKIGDKAWVWAFPHGLEQVEVTNTFEMSGGRFFIEYNRGYATDRFWRDKNDAIHARLNLICGMITDIQSRLDDPSRNFGWSWRPAFNDLSDLAKITIGDKNARQKTESSGNESRD